MKIQIVNRVRSIQNVVLLLLGAALPYCLTCAVLSLLGVFDRFWFWTVTYAGSYGSQISLTDGLGNLKMGVSQIANVSLPLLSIALTGCATMLWDRRIRKQASFLVLFAIFSFAAVCPGLYFREHYFILILPVVSLFAGVASASARSLLSLKPSKILPMLPIAVFVCAIVYTAWLQRYIFFELSPVDASRAIYSMSPFPESLEIAEHIRAMTADNDRIAVIGSEPQLYFYTHRRSATGYLYTYSLMEDQPYALQMQREMVAEIESKHPAIIVFVNHPASWLARPASERFLIRWTVNYTQSSYEVVGIVDMVSRDHIVYLWGSDVQGYKARSPNHVLVFRRRQSS